MLSWDTRDPLDPKFDAFSAPADGRPEGVGQGGAVGQGCLGGVLPAAPPGDQCV